MVLLDTKQAAHRLGWSEGTLRKKRMTGEGPAFLKLGRSVRYAEKDLIAYVEANRRRSTCDASRDAA